MTERSALPRISLIVAVAENGVIGRDGDLPWRLSRDLQRFKRLTMGHHLVMGRKTYESIGRPLPGRTMVVISRQDSYAPAGVEVVSSLDDAFARARESEEDELFVAGGGEIYRLALPQVERIYRTRVHAEVDGDVYFPELDDERWRLSESEGFEADDRNSHRTTFEVLDRVAAKTSC